MLLPMLMLMLISEGNFQLEEAFTDSSSVAAGLPIQEKPIMFRAALSISPSMPGALELAG